MKVDIDVNEAELLIACLTWLADNPSPVMGAVADLRPFRSHLLTQFLRAKTAQP